MSERSLHTREVAGSSTSQEPEGQPMTPRAEAMSDPPTGRMVVWKCPECGRRGLDYGERRTLVCFWNGEDSQHTGVEVERIEVVPATELERETDALEAYRKERDWLENRLREKEADLGRALDALATVVSTVDLRSAPESTKRKVRAVLRAAGRLDG